MLGERISEGNGSFNSVGSRSCSVRTVLPSWIVRSSGGLWSPCCAGGRVDLGAELLNQMSLFHWSISLTCAKHRQLTRHDCGAAAATATTAGLMTCFEVRADGRSDGNSLMDVI